METDNLVRMAVADGNSDLRYVTSAAQSSHSATASNIDRDLVMSTSDDPFASPPAADKSQGNYSVLCELANNAYCSSLTTSRQSC